jgi:hypothetical protein
MELYWTKIGMHQSGIPDSDTDSNTLQGAVRVERIWTQTFTAALVSLTQL